MHRTISGGTDSKSGGTIMYVSRREGLMFWVFVSGELRRLVMKLLCVLCVDAYRDKNGKQGSGKKGWSTVWAIRRGRAVEMSSGQWSVRLVLRSECV